MSRRLGHVPRRQFGWGYAWPQKARPYTAPALFRPARRRRSSGETVAPRGAPPLSLRPLRARGIRRALRRQVPRRDTARVTAPARLRVRTHALLASLRCSRPRLQRRGGLRSLGRAALAPLRSRAGARAMRWSLPACGGWPRPRPPWPAAPFGARPLLAALVSPLLLAAMRLRKPPTQAFYAPVPRPTSRLCWLL